MKSEIEKIIIQVTPKEQQEYAESILKILEFVEIPKQKSDRKTLKHIQLMYRLLSYFDTDKPHQ